MHALPPSLDLVALHEFAAVLGTRMTDLLIISDAYSWVFKIVSWFFVSAPPSPLRKGTKLTGDLDNYR